MIQTTIFDMLYPKYKIDKPIRLIEFFAGYGSQALALKYLGVPFEHWKICEWAVKSIQAYKDIHFTDEHLTFNKERTKDEIVEYLYQKGISANYNKPMTKEQISRLNENQLKTILENIAITHNLVNIQQVKGSDLEIVDSDKYTYLLTYSFPCQDLSLAGKRQGMNDTSTRSGMLWEVERILDECKKLGDLPQVLLMENVPQVHGEGNTNDFNKWQSKLEQLGYKNYWEDLIATDYGIPQTRNRCFMVSILGEYSYSFPPKQPLKLRLKDMLEKDVDEKYYIEDDLLQPNSETRRARVQKETIQTLDTMGGDGKGVVVLGNYSPSGHNASRVVDKSCVAPTIMENHGTITATQTSDLRIRKLTPKECFRLMGVKDEDFEKCAKNQSNASLYHLAGDSIVVNVLMAIFKEMKNER